MTRLLPLEPATRVQPGFEALWEAYPPRRPNPRAAALATWRVLVRSVDQEQLVTAARAYAAEVTAQTIKPEFVPHLRTWLAQRRYLDYPPFARPAEPAAAAAPAAAAPGGIEHPWWPEAQRSGLVAAEFTAWIGKLRLLSVDRETSRAYLEAPTTFVCDFCAQHYTPLLSRAIGVETVRITSATKPGHVSPEQLRREQGR